MEKIPSSDVTLKKMKEHRLRHRSLIAKSDNFNEV